MSFFDDAGTAPAPPPPPSYRLPEWVAPPENVRPATVALDIALVRREGLAVWVDDARVYPAGVVLGVSVHRREREPRTGPGVPFHEHTAGALRLGLELADGRKVVVRGLGEMKPFLQRPGRPVLRPRGGSSGGGRAQAELWLWPLPPAGPLTFVCDWPAEAIGETRATVDAAEIVAAAARAVELWPDDRPLPPSEDEVVV